MKLPKYVGSIVQNYRKRARDGQEGRPTRAFQKWFDDLEQIMKSSLLESLKGSGMLLDDSIYELAGANPKNFLLEVPDFNGLIAISQDLSKPVFTLTKEEIQTSGSVANNQLSNVGDFNKIYAAGAKKIIDIVKGF